MGLREFPRMIPCAVGPPGQAQPTQGTMANNKGLLLEAAKSWSGVL